MVAGTGYVVSSFVTLVLPQFLKPVTTVTSLMIFGELPIMLWLLIWGAITRPGEATVTSTGRPT
jgi:hypothetical protein